MPEALTGDLTCDLFTSSSEVDAEEWSSVCDVSTNPFMDLKFFDVLNRSITSDTQRSDTQPSDTQTWGALIRDTNGRPVAATCFSLYRVDGALFLPGWLRPPTELIRRLFRNYLSIPLLIGGHPVGVGQSHLQMRQDADPKAVVEVLDRTAQELARAHRAKLILFKEFTQSEAEQLNSLTTRGYSRSQSVETWTLNSEWASFDNYYETRSKRTRANMRKYFGKLEAAGMTFEEHRGADGVSELFTDEIYQLYENVLDRASLRFEKVPLSFFQELAREFPEESRFAFIRQADQIVGFTCGLGTGHHHALLYCGIDYERNDEAAIYFNTLYRGLAAAIETGAQTINVGQSADEFKRRLGCKSAPLFIFTKPMSPVLGLGFRLFVN